MERERGRTVRESDKMGVKKSSLFQEEYTYTHHKTINRSDQGFSRKGDEVTEPYTDALRGKRRLSSARKRSLEGKKPRRTDEIDNQKRKRPSSSLYDEGKWDGRERTERKHEVRRL